MFDSLCSQPGFHCGDFPLHAIMNVTCTVRFPDIVCADEIVGNVSTVSLSRPYKASEVNLSNRPRSYWQSSQVVSRLASSSLIISFCSPCCAFNARSVCPKSLSGAMTLRTRDLRALTSIERTRLAVNLQRTRAPSSHDVHHTLPKYLGIKEGGQVIKETWK